MTTSPTSPSFKVFQFSSIILISVNGGTARPQLEGYCKYSSPPLRVPNALVSDRP